MIIDLEKEQLASELRGSLLGFCRFFYPLLSGKAFIVSNPTGRESHHITISRALTRAARLEVDSQRLLINTPPGSGKSLLMTLFVAWTLASYPDSKYIYVSYSKTLADKMTEQIKRVMELREYSYLFGVHIRKDSKAKDYFQTTAGGVVASAGSAGTITGLNAGDAGVDHWSGCLILDDLIKPDEAHSEHTRQKVISNYTETLQQRLRGKKVPVIAIGQRVHEADISNFFLSGKEGYDWEKVILKAVDEAGNFMYPEVYSKDMLTKKKETAPYVFSSQYQQEPIPAGGALYRPEWLVLLEDEPTMLATFVVCDTAETSKTYRDASAFGFFGLYEIEHKGRKTGLYGLHVIHAIEVRVEPKDLKDVFMDFWADCMRHEKTPSFAAIEKKSTGVTLLSVLQEIRGMRVVDIPRSSASGSKTKRFLDVQPLIAEKRVSFPEYGRHTKWCIEHLSKITANDSHAHDDFADILADSIRLALVEKTVMAYANIKSGPSAAEEMMGFQAMHLSSLRRSAYS